MLRTRELTPSMIAAVVLADQAVRQCFEATARTHGVELRPADDDVIEDADHRAEQIKSMLDAISARIRPLTGIVKLRGVGRVRFQLGG
jgi:hypothetical protein